MKRLVKVVEWLDAMLSEMTSTSGKSSLIDRSGF